MNRNELKLLDVVALVDDIPAHALVRGQVGTIVEELGPETYEVEFSDNDGKTYALAAIGGSKLLALRHEPADAM